jgi:hypothetical protein
LGGNYETKGEEGTGLRKVEDEDHDDKIREMKLQRTVLAEDTAHNKAIRKRITFCEILYSWIRAS